MSAASGIKAQSKRTEGVSSGWRQIVGHVFHNGFFPSRLAERASADVLMMLIITENYTLHTVCVVQFLKYKRLQQNLFCCCCCLFVF